MAKGICIIDSFRDIIDDARSVAMNVCNILLAFKHHLKLKKKLSWLALRRAA